MTNLLVSTSLIGLKNSSSKRVYTVLHIAVHSHHTCSIAVACNRHLLLTQSVMLGLVNSSWSLIDWVEFIVPSAWYQLCETPMVWTWAELFVAPPPSEARHKTGGYMWYEIHLIAGDVSNCAWFVSNLAQLVACPMHVYKAFVWKYNVKLFILQLSYVAYQCLCSTTRHTEHDLKLHSIDHSHWWAISLFVSVVSMERIPRITVFIRLHAHCMWTWAVSI